MKNRAKKAFSLWSAIFLGIGSMVGAGIFIVIGQAGAIAGNLVWVSFIFGGIIALLSGYSLAKLAIRYPSRGGVTEYLVQSFGENIFSGSVSVLFYFAQLVVIAAVAKSFGTYASTLMDGGAMWIDGFAIGIVALFTLINLIGASSVAKAENIIVVLKLSILVLFVIIALFTIEPERLSVAEMPPMNNMLFAIGLTFFAYQGFSVIINTIEDMENPKVTMMRAMLFSILLVAVLYVLTSIAVLGNLSLDEVLKTQDYALAEASKPIFGEWGFKIMAITALIATASAINATLYAVSEIGYSMAKEGNLPKVYEYNIYNAYEGLVISAVLIVPMILFFNLAQITTVATVVMLIVQGITHIGHFIKRKETGAKGWIILLTIIAMFVVAGLTLYSTHQSMPNIIYYLILSFCLAMFIEIALRLFTQRVISQQI